MKTRVQEICKQRGLSIRELSRQIGVDPSSLLQSLKGNPTVGTLKSIADCLHVSLTELFDDKSQGVYGYLEVNGEVKKIASKKDLIPVIGTFGVETYVSYKVCKKDLGEFLKRDLKGKRSDTFNAIVDGTLLINVFKTIVSFDDAEETRDKFYAVTINTVDGRKYCYSYEGVEFWGANDEINHKDLLREMWCEIIGCIEPEKSYEADEEMDRLGLE